MRCPTRAVRSLPPLESVLVEDKGRLAAPPSCCPWSRAARAGWCGGACNTPHALAHICPHPRAAQTAQSGCLPCQPPLMLCAPARVWTATGTKPLRPRVGLPPAPQAFAQAWPSMPGLSRLPPQLMFVQFRIWGVPADVQFAYLCALWLGTALV